ncbi:MAG: hypothetical protein BYD32DRAFT_404046 [Podila humilis]|nr:MAG: hypothetical protein BYD32DRAFT_404046 [Podila humilis]
MSTSTKMLGDDDGEERARLVPLHSSFLASPPPSPSPSLLSTSALLQPHAPLLKLNITSTELSSSSTTPSPTSSTSSSPETVSFTFSSPLFYDQKLCIYQSLLQIYQQLGKLLTTHPAMLLVLQYSIAAIHGFTVYLLSVVLSLAQLIMITATIENLDWIQTYKPLMREWDSRFPGFVFPAQDIDSESDDDMDPYEEDYLSSSARRRKLAKRYSSHALALKAGDDDDGYHSEESQRRIGASMNLILRRRLAKCQQWMPSLWSAEENSITEEQEEDGSEEERQDEAANNSQDQYSTRIRKALVRTLSGNIKTSKSKRVTFNEQVLILGRRLSGETSNTSKSSPASVLPMTPVSVQDKNSLTDISSALVAGSINKDNRASPETTQTLTSAEIEAMAQEESRYQKTIATQDTNGSGTSSPVFQPSPDLSKTSPPPEHSPSSTSSQGSDVSMSKDSPDLRRSISVPHKIGSFFGRHNHGSNNSTNAPQQNTITRHSATFSESSTVAQNPRAASIHVTLPSHPATGPSTGSSTMVPRREPSSAESTPRSSMSLGTRAKRSFSLALPRPNSISANTSIDAPPSNASSVERQGSIGKKNKNFMYRIVHPQRYKRELEQQLTEQERQRLLALAQLQRRQFLAAESSTDMAGSTSHLCGDAYFYATSAEYIDDLGAPNSVISTSIGTSFPAELQGKKTQLKNHTKQRPASYDYGYRPAVLFPGACGYSSESDSALEGSATEETSSQAQKLPRSQSFFKRDGKKNSVSGKTALQQLFSHPGHQQTQSTSSLIVPPGAGSYSTTTTIGPSVPGMNMSSDGSLPQGFSSSAAAGAHRLLARGRTNSRTFTSFTAMAMPAFPPAQPALTASMTCPKNNPSINSGTSEHTSFADFGFPSPTLSPTLSPVKFVPSASSSPRHSTSSAPDIMYSSAVFRHEQQEVLSDQSLDSDDTFYGVSQLEQPQQLQEMLPIVETKAEPLTPGTSRESSMTLSSNGSVTKESRSKIFMRKLSLRKKKN